MKAQPRRGFTLIEILVVVAIVLIISAAALPAVIGALSARRVEGAAQILQGALVGARDRAIHANAPCGIRLMPDPTIALPRLAANRLVDIDSGSDYFEGMVQINPSFNISAPGWNNNVLVVYEQVADPSTSLPNSPTSWAWNVRIGDRFRFNDSGRYYTVVGPLATANNEGYINYPGNVSPTLPPPMDPTGVPTDYLFLVNGVDDNGDGYIDEQMDGIDNNLNGFADYMLDVTEAQAPWESEQWLGDQLTALATSPTGTLTNMAYTITRRPYPAPSARETSLPAGAVIDLTTCMRTTVGATTYTATQERSHLPVDPQTQFVDIMINQNGQVLPVTYYSNPSSLVLTGPYQFWICDREDVRDPVAAQTNVPYTLPMPRGTPKYPNAADTLLNTTFLTGERRLVSLFPRSGAIVVGNIEPATVIIPGTPSTFDVYSSGFLGTDITDGSGTTVQPAIFNPYLDSNLGINTGK